MNKKVVAILTVVVAVALWIVWPSKYGRVANLGSKGSAIIAFGDSLTSGDGAGPGEDYPSRLSAISGIPVVNAGISGDTTNSALERIERDVLSRNPRIVIVGLGGNDFLGGSPIASTEANLRTIVKRIQGAGAMVVLLGFKFPSFNANYETMYERVAKDEKCLLVAGTLAGILTDPALKSDEIHPNARGYDLMAQRIAPPLQKLLRAADKTR